MPKTATPRKPETVSRKLAETRNTSKNRSLSSLLGIGDNEKRLATDIASGLNDVAGRGTIAALLGLPADLGGLLWDGGAWVNNKIKDVEYATGMLKPDLASLVTGQRKGYVPYSQGNPYLGAEDIGNRMEQAGLVSNVRRPKTELLASLISPAQAATAGYKAPQMARAVVKALDNLASAPTMARMGQRGAIILNPSPFKVAHGSADEFDAFKSGMGVTAKHIYTTPEEFADDAFKYGNHRYVAEASPSSVIDFGDYDKLDGKTLSAMEKAAVDAGLVDEYTSFDDVLERVMSGNLYNGSGGPRDQNAFLGELLSEYGAVRMPDAGFDGAVSQSYVFDDPSALRILERNGQPTGNLGKMVAPQDEALRVAQGGDLQAPLSVADNAPMSKPLFVTIGGSRYPVTDMLDAARKYDMYREQADAGASMLPPVDIVDDAGNVVANFSYNGRLWKGARGASDRVEIDPANWTE